MTAFAGITSSIKICLPDCSLHNVPGTSQRLPLTKFWRNFCLPGYNNDIAAMALLELSATFYIVDQRILLRWLRTSFGVKGMVLAWFGSNLSCRTQYVSLRSRRSCPGPVLSVVTKGSVLGPIFIILYTANFLSSYSGLYSTIAFLNRRPSILLLLYAVNSWPAPVPSIQAHRWRGKPDAFQPTAAEFTED